MGDCEKSARKIAARIDAGETDIVSALLGAFGDGRVHEARALAAERAAHRELREAVREYFDADEAWLSAYGAEGDDGCVAEAAARSLAERKVHALVGWPEGARDGDK